MLLHLCYFRLAIGSDARVYFSTLENSQCNAFHLFAKVEFPHEDPRFFLSPLAFASTTYSQVSSYALKACGSPDPKHLLGS